MKGFLLVFFLFISMFLAEGCGGTGSFGLDANTTAKEVYLEPYLKKNGLKLLIPMYVYPTPSSVEWKKLIDFKKAYPHIEIITIINPSNGHFSKPDSNYEQIVQKLVDANIKVIGYVYTKYAKRDIKEVQADIDAWMQFYRHFGVNGIFFDEADSNSKNLPYYKKLSEYARGDGFNMVVLNPGTTVDSAYVDANIADIIVNYENPYGDLSHTTTWNTPTKNTSLAMLVYGVDDNKVGETVQKAVDNNIGYIYLTDANKLPWNTISKYLAVQTPAN